MTRTVRAARGTGLTARSWQTEAAWRMLHNNLDPEVAERPEDLVVYGGTGKAARDWPSFDAIARTLLDLREDETLLVQSGRPVGVLRTTSGRRGCCSPIRISFRTGRIGRSSGGWRRPGSPCTGR